MIYLIILATIISTTLGGLFAIKFRDKLHLILGFSAGAVLGVALFDLLPEAAELSTDIRKTALYIVFGFIAYLIFDRFFSIHPHSDEHCENPDHNGKLGATTLIIHSFLDGLGIGLAFKVSPTIGWIVAAAVLAHDFSDGINTANMILKDLPAGQVGARSRKTALWWLVADALAPAVGVLATLFFTISEKNLGLVLAIFTGLFLYIGAAELIPESHHRHPTLWTSAMTIAGVALIYLVIRVAT